MTGELPPVEVPEEIIPKNLAEALVAIGKLQVVCSNQEAKLREHDQEVADLKAVIATANGVKLTLFWLGGAIVALSAIYYNVIRGNFGK